MKKNDPERIAPIAGNMQAGWKQFQAVAVLSVESDLVRFSVLSAADGRELVTSTKRLSLLTAAQDSSSAAVSDNPPPLRRGHVEQDPELVWAAVEQAMDECVDGMCRDGAPVTYIKSMGIVNEMGTLLSWSNDTGKPLHNAIHWTDARMMASRGGTAAAVEWLTLQSRTVYCSAANCRLGTWDAWLLWKLTGGQTYSTDLTNASYTRLLDLDTGDWNWDACQTRGLTKHAWPEIRPHGVHSVVLVGRLLGTAVHAVMARPSATLYGQECYRRGQVAVTMADRTSVALGSCERRPSDKALETDGDVDGGPWPVIGYCEPNAVASSYKVVYGLLAVTKANSVVRWTKNVGLVASTFECMKAYDSNRPGGPDQAFLVPALDGLPTAPHNRADARLVVCGLTEKMGREHLIAAAVDAISYSVFDMLRCIAAVPGGPSRVDTAFVDGAYCRHVSVLQQLANVSGSRVVRNRDDMAVHGVARMAAAAINTVYRAPGSTVIFRPTITKEQRLAGYGKWANAVLKSYGWEQTEGARVDDKHFTCSRAPPKRSVTDYLTNLFGSCVLWCRTVMYDLRERVFGDPNA